MQNQAVSRGSGLAPATGRVARLACSLKPAPLASRWGVGGASGAACSAVRIESSTSAPPFPVPVVTIDNLSDPLATIVEISFGDLLGELLDTMQALKNLGLNITRATLEDGCATTGKAGINRFYVTDAKTSDKIVLSERLEEIRGTIINNMLQYHPESRDVLAAGRRAGAVTERALGARAPSAVPTTITVSPDRTGSRSALVVRTVDRPGLLVDIVRTLKDCSLNVVSANVATVGLQAEDTFYVTYHGAALSKNMEQLIINALQYFLMMAELEKEESY